MTPNTFKGRHKYVGLPQRDINPTRNLAKNGLAKSFNIPLQRVSAFLNFHMSLNEFRFFTS
jgi:hypothetical protein